MARRRRFAISLALLALVAIACDTSGGTGIDRRRAEAERADRTALAGAEEAFLARNSRYGTEEELVDAGLLPAPSTIHDIALERPGTLGSVPGYVIDCAEPGCGGPEHIDELRFRAQGSFGISPFSANGSPNPASLPMMSLMFDTLTWRDAAGAVPWLTTPAEAPPAGMETTPAGGLVTADHLEYRYVVRTGATWHDGTPLTPDDVVFTFEYMKGRKAAGFSVGFPPPGGPVSRAIDYIASVRVDPADPSGRTVVFTLHDPATNPCPPEDASCLEGPWVPFEDLLVGAAPIVPRHVWGPDANATCRDKGGPGNTCVQDPVNRPPERQYLGSGPYILHEPTFDPDRLVGRFDANQRYFRGAPYVRRISFVPVGEAQELNALRSGRIDGVSAGGNGITPAALESFRNFTHVSGPPNADVNIHFNLTRGFPFDRKEFRQAIAHAIDRPALVASALNGRGRPGSLGGLSPESPAVADDLPSYDHDLAEARRLLDAIGVVDGDGDGLRDLPVEGCGAGPPCGPGKGGTKLWVDTGNRAVAAIVADTLREGLKLDIVSHSQDPPFFTFGTYNMALFSETNLTGDPDRLRTHYSDRVTSQTYPGTCGDAFGCRKNPPIMVFGYADPTFVDLADRQAVEFDPAARLEKVQQLQRRLAEDLPFISLFVPERLFLHRPGTVPFYFTPGGVAGSPFGGTALNKQVFVTGKRTG